MKNAKMHMCIIASILVCLLSGCGFHLPNFTDFRDPIADLGFTRSEDVMCDNVMNVLVDGLRTKDTTGVKALFSEDAMANVQMLDKQIQEFFRYVRGNILHYDGGAYYYRGETALSYGENGEIHGGRQWKQIEGEYEIVTDIETYDVVFAFYTDYPSHPEKNGLYFVEIMPKNTADSMGCQHSIQTEQGIFLYPKM